MKVVNKIVSIALLSMIFGLTGCNQSPVRNPFAGRQEPDLGSLPPLSEARSVSSKIAWTKITFANQIRFSKLQPYITDEVLFSADQSGKVLALARDTGKVLWKKSTKNKFLAGPYLIENYLFITTSDAMVVAMDAKTGHILWEKKASSEVLAPLAGQQGIVIAHASDGSVTAYTMKDGKELWRMDHSTPALTLRYCSAPVVVDDKVLVGFATGKMCAFDLHTGGLIWERAITIPRGRSEIQRMVDICADPIVMGDIVYAITYQGKLAGVNITTGDLLWDRDLSSYQNMAHDEQYLYITDNQHHVWAIDRFSGATVWKQNALAERYITGPEVLHGKVIVADRAGFIHYLSASNGHILDRQHISGKFYQNPKRMGDALLISTFKGKLVALNVS